MSRTDKLEDAASEFFMTIKSVKLGYWSGRVILVGAGLRELHTNISWSLKMSIRALTFLSELR